MPRQLSAALTLLITAAVASRVMAEDPAEPVEAAPAEAVPAAPSSPTFLPSFPWPRFNPQLLVPTPILRRRACAADYKVPCQRGVAILSPLESPDHCDYPVGGKCVLTPYYPDYCAHRKKGPRIFIPGNGVGYFSRRGKRVAGYGEEFVDENGQAITETGYGAYQGARQDEENLLRLGGFSGEDAEQIDADGAACDVDAIEMVPAAP
ncbi:MAG TPA: hypothetical protein VHD36_00965 [Pirellulales bacterium]|nr:hypothetical protein [Pirellulales bacterium]